MVSLDSGDAPGGFADPTTRFDVDSLLPRVYEELHQLAEQYFRSQPANHTLQPTALVHEAFVRLSRAPSSDYESRNHFYCVAAMAMRQILVNHARDKNRQKRGGGLRRVSLDVEIGESGESPLDIEALNEALEDLGRQDRRKFRVVELRYFGGLSVEETAEALEISPTTVKSDWTFAKAWLHRRLRQGASDD